MESSYSVAVPSATKTTPSTDAIILTWKDVSVWVKKKLPQTYLNVFSGQQFEHIRILNKVSGCVKSGTLMAIMGSSGAGKTTLMATISQRVKGTETVGEVLVNRRPISKEIMCRISGFVPQDELVTRSLTVQEHMQFMARLLLDARVTPSQRHRRINSLLLDLGLTKCSYTRISELSGGEFKRLALAVQLLTDPPLLFCDEPTTGLDSYNAGIVIEKLRDFAVRGKVVVCTIHQPASGIFELFHEVVLLAGGRVAFQGSVSDAARHFESANCRCPVGYNQAEFFVSQLAITSEDEDACHRKVQNICDLYDGSKYAEAVRQQVFDSAVEIVTDCTPINGYDNRVDWEFQKYSSIKKIDWCTELSWLMWREYIDVKRHRQEILVRFMLYMFIALLLATPYANIMGLVDQRNIQNIEGLMYLIITETVFTFAYSVFHTFPASIPQLLREVGNGLYTPSSFYICKILLSIPSAVVMPFVYTLVIFAIVGLRGGVLGFIQFSIPVIVAAVASTAYGFAMSAAFESVAIASLVSVPIDFINIVFAGIFVNLANLPAHLMWVRYLSPFYYGTEAVSILQWSQVDDIQCNNEDGAFPCIRTGRQVLAKYGFHPDHLYLDLMGLTVYYLVLHVIGFVCFWRRSRKQAIY